MHDRDVREAVLRQLQAKYAGDFDTRIVEEMGVWSGSVRVDIAVINGELSGYELKSDRDTLERLPAQEELYSRVFDRVTLVVGARHHQKARSQIPEWWGLTVADMSDGQVELRTVREAQRNVALDGYLVAQLLWKEEALTVLGAHGLAKGWRSKTAPAIHERMATEIPLATLAENVRQVLKRREGWLR